MRKFLVALVIMFIGVSGGVAYADTVTPPSALPSTWYVEVTNVPAFVTVQNYSTISAYGGCVMQYKTNFNGTKSPIGAQCDSAGTLIGKYEKTACDLHFIVTSNGVVIHDSVFFPCPPPPTTVPVQCASNNGVLVLTNPNTVAKDARCTLYIKTEATLSSTVPFTAVRVGHNGHPFGNRFKWIWVWDGYSVTMTVPASATVSVVATV